MRKAHAVILSIFFISILISSYYLYFAKATVTVGDKNFKLSIIYDSYFIDENGNKLALVSSGGQTVESYHLELQYTIDGEEINWDTLTVEINGLLTIYLNEITPDHPNGTREILHNETLINVTTSKRSSSYTLDISAVDLIKPVAEKLYDNATVIFEIMVTIIANAEDRYGIQRTARWKGFYAKSFIWREPTLEIITPGSDNTEEETEEDEDSDDTTVTAYDRGYQRGYDMGYRWGYQDAKLNRRPRYTEKSDHKGTSYFDGYKDGIQDGYVDGYNEGMKSRGGAWGLSSLDTEGMRRTNVEKAILLISFSSLLIGGYYLIDIFSKRNRRYTRTRKGRRRGR
mgnify:CR=1 FL=1